MAELDFSYLGPDRGVWLPEYEPVGVHSMGCAVWKSNLPCDCKDAPTTAERLDLIDGCDEMELGEEYAPDMERIIGEQP